TSVGLDRGSILVQAFRRAALSPMPSAMRDAPSGRSSPFINAVSRSDSETQLRPSGWASTKPATTSPALRARSATARPCPPAPHINHLSAIVASEWFHGCVPRLGDPVAPEDLHEGPEEDPAVEQERAVLDIPGVHLESILPAYRIATVDLGPAGDAGSYLVTSELPRVVQWQVFRQQRPRSYQRHLARDHIPEARQLVQRSRPQQPPE